MMLNPTLGSNGGAGPGADPDPIDTDVEIIVGTDAQSFADARALAMTYRGRMAYGRHVTIRLPQGVTTITNPADLQFHGIDFPELRILGQQPWSYTSTGVTIALAEDRYDLTYEMDYTGGLVVGDVVVVTADNLATAAHPLRALAGISGAHEIAEVTTTSVRVRTSNPSLWIVDGQTLSTSDLGSAGALSIRKMASVIDIDGAPDLFVARGTRMGGIADVALRAVSGSYVSGIVVDDSELALSDQTTTLAVVPSLDGVEAYSDAVRVSSSKAIFPTLVLAPHHSGFQAVSVADSDVSIAALHASNMRFNATGAATTVQIQSGLASGAPGLPFDSDLLISGPVDVHCPGLVYVPGGSEMLATASRGARIWIKDSNPIDGGFALTSPAPGTVGNDGAEIYLAT